LSVIVVIVNVQVFVGSDVDIAVIDEPTVNEPKNVAKVVAPLSIS
jgi:hypothetical protein